MATHRILVTGAAGYIGRFVCQELVRQGFLAVAFDDFTRGRVVAPIDGIVENGLMTAESLGAVMTRHRPIAVIHLAGGRGGRHKTSKSTLSEDPILDWTRILLAVMAEHKVQNFVFASSSAVYSDPRSAYAAEDTPLRAASAYGKSKIAAEGLVRAWGEDADRGWVILRYANAAGADPVSMLGWHEGDKMIVPSAIAVACGKRDALDLYGDDLPTPDGTAVRDLIHCWDIAAATTHMVRQCMAGGTKEILNVGSGRGISVAQVVALTEQVTQRRIRVVRRDARDGEIAALVLSSERLARLGFTPRHSDPMTIVSSSWEWYQKAVNLDRYQRV
jgi:UDP-glucose 4-epimerase